MKMMLAIAGVEMPDYSYRISDLVSLERKRHFADTFIPELEARAGKVSAGEGSREGLGDWIDSELASYGPDARLLVANAFRAYVGSARESEPSKKPVLDLAESVFFL